MSIVFILLDIDSRSLRYSNYYVRKSDMLFVLLNSWTLICC